MKIPRDLEASIFCKKLQFFDYHISRQKGSHIRLSTTRNGEHHITIPNHSPIKIGTLNSILNEISNHLAISKQDLVNELF
jgi:predicted RNA binding protein YcfA (HicA-like mRNA interferase family)